MDSKGTYSVILEKDLYQEVKDLCSYIEHGTEYRIFELGVAALKQRYKHIHKTDLVNYTGLRIVRSLYMYDTTIKEIKAIGDKFLFLRRSDMIGLIIKAFKEKYNIRKTNRPSLDDLIS